MTEEELSEYEFSNDPDWQRTTTTTAGDRYHDPRTGARYLITKYVPRCQSAKADGEQCTRTALNKAGYIRVDGPIVNIPRCAQHGGEVVQWGKRVWRAGA